MEEHCIEITYFDDEGNASPTVKKAPGSPPHVVVHPHEGKKVRITNKCDHPIEVHRHENGQSLDTIEPGQTKDLDL